MNYVQKILLSSHEMAREIEDFRFAGRFKSETEALRALVRAGLDRTRMGEAVSSEKRNQIAA
jgi:Arc/MetJ-type ribon-helix-helix transcriptional regulator